MNGRTNEWANERADRQTDGRMDEKMKRRIDKRMNERTNRRMNERVNGWTDVRKKRSNGRKIGLKVKHFYRMDLLRLKDDKWKTDVYVIFFLWPFIQAAVHNAFLQSYPRHSRVGKLKKDRLNKKQCLLRFLMCLFRMKSSCCNWLIIYRWFRSLSIWVTFL